MAAPAPPDCSVAAAGRHARAGGSAAYAACCAFTIASTADSRLFSTIAPGYTVWILSNTRNVQRSLPSN